MKSIRNFGLKIMLGTVVVASASAAFADSYVGGDGLSYPYCTKNMPAGSGFGWQPELNGPNGGSCKIPELRFVVNNKSTINISINLSCADTNAVFINPWKPYSLQPGGQASTTCDGPNWIYIQYNNGVDTKDLVVAVASVGARNVTKDFVNRADGKGAELVPAN